MPQDAESPPAARAQPGARATRDAPLWATLVGALGGLLLAAAPFLPWIRIQAGEAERFGRALESAARAEAEGAGGAGLSEVGRRLAERHVLTGLDLVQWSREARARLTDERSAQPAAPARRTQLARAWGLVPLLVLGLAAAGAVLAGTLVAHRLRRFRAPLQVVTGVASVLAGGLAGVWAWGARPLSSVATLELGHDALLWGGALTLTALIGALRWASLAVVLFAVLLTLLALGALAWGWLHLPT